MNIAVWGKRMKCLFLVAFFASIGNYISTSKAGTPVTPIQAVPGLLLLLLCTVFGSVIYEVINKFSTKNLPAIAYISLTAILMTIPGLHPWAGFCAASMGKIGLLPLCTPILAYAGISLGKDLDTFKEQGVGIIVVALFTFVGTYLGSVVIAQIILSVTGVI